MKYTPVHLWRVFDEGRTGAAAWGCVGVKAVSLWTRCRFITGQHRQANNIQTHTYLTI